MDQLWWDVARAGGIVGWCLLAASVVWGLAISTKTTPGLVRPGWMLDLHRFLGGLAMVFVGVHVTGLLLDSYVHFGLAELLVPLASSWHPVAVAWGITGMYLLAAVELTSLARRRLPRRVWRAVHALAFPTFALGDRARADRRHRPRQPRLAGHDVGDDRGCHVPHGRAVAAARRAARRRARGRRPVVAGARPDGPSGLTGNPLVERPRT